LTSERKRSANLANSRASTGPKSRLGRARSARNALRHGLNVPVELDATVFENVEALARELVKGSSNPENDDLARRVAEAQIELARVRCVRWRLLASSFKDLSQTDTPTRTTVGRTVSPADLSLKSLAPSKTMAAPKLPSNVSHLIKQLLAIDRYERRALWHRRCALRACTNPECIPKVLK
jgi:hypothetical protein